MKYEKTSILKDVTSNTAMPTLELLFTFTSQSESPQTALQHQKIVCPISVQESASP